MPKRHSKRDIARIVRNTAGIRINNQLRHSDGITRFDKVLDHLDSGSWADSQAHTAILNAIWDGIGGRIVNDSGVLVWDVLLRKFRFFYGVMNQ